MAQGITEHNPKGPARAQRLKRWQSLQSDALQTQAHGDVGSVSTVRFALMLVTLATAFTLYIGHVYETQDRLNALQEVRRENVRLNLYHNELRGAADEAVGPSVIYERAPALGLRDGYSYAPLVRTR